MQVRVHVRRHCAHLLQIFVKTASSQTIALEAEAADTVCTLKSRFFEKTGRMMAAFETSIAPSCHPIH